MPTPQISLVDTALYGDSYVGNSIARGVALYNHAGSDDTTTGRLSTIGFYGKTSTGSDPHTVAKIQTHAYDATRKGVLQVMLNAGSASADAEFEALKVDATGAFKVQMWDSANEETVANMDLSAAGTLNVRDKMVAPKIEASTQLKGPNFDAIGDTVTMGPAATQLQVDAATKKVQVSDGASNAFVVDLDQSKVSTTMAAQFDKTLVVGNGTSMSSKFYVNDGSFKCESKNALDQFMQFTADATSGGTVGLVVQAPTATPGIMSKLVVASSKAQMINSSDSKGFTVDHDVPKVVIDYNAEFGQSVSVAGATTFSNNVTIGSAAAPKSLQVYGTENVSSNLTVGGALDVSGTSNFALAVSMQNTLDVTSNASVGGTFNASGAASFGSTLNVTGNATVGGNAAITGTLAAGASTLNSLNVTTDATINGNLTVIGEMTTIQSTQVMVNDKAILLANTNTPSRTTALGAGIEVLYAPGGNKTFLYAEPQDDSSLAAFGANVGLNVPGQYAYQIDGAKVMTQDYVNLPLSTAAYKIAGVSLLTQSELVLAQNADGKAIVKMGDWRLCQTGDSLFIEKYDAADQAWKPKAQYK
jgi:hypothetical protein